MSLPLAYDDNFEDIIDIELEDCDVYKTQEGILYIGRSDQFMSIGFIEIEPSKETTKRSRPVPGFLKQIEGSSTIKIYNGDKIEDEILLKKDESIKIEANKNYIIKCEGTERCMLFWKFSGDVTEAFENMKKSLQKIQIEARPKSGYKNLYEEHKSAIDEYYNKKK